MRIEATRRAGHPGGAELSRDRLWNGSAFQVVDFCWDREQHSSARIGQAELSAFLFFREGIFVSRVGGRVGVGDANHVLFYNPSDEFRVSFADAARTAGTSFRIRPAALEELLGELAPGRSVSRPFRAASRLTPPAEYLLGRSLAEHLADPAPKDELFVDEALTMLTRAIVLGDTDASGARRADPSCRKLRTRIPELISFLNTEPFRDIRFADLVDRMRCSPWYLSRVFHEETGLPIYRYVRRLRVRLALARILAGATSLTDVALDAGFASHSNFTRAFHEEFRMSPSYVRDRASRERIREVVRRLEV